MSTPIVSADAKVRLQEAVKHYTPPAPEKYRALEEVKECVIELRAKKASYQTITTMLHDAAGIDVPHQTVARYCREVLEEAKPAKKTNRSRATKADAARKSNDEEPEKPASFTQRELLSSGSSSSSHRSRGPRIADVKNL